MDDSRLDEIRRTLTIMGEKAVKASRCLAVAAPEDKKRCLEAMADALTSDRRAIIAANAEDMAAAEKNGMAPAMLDRLRLDDKRVAGMAAGLRQIAAQPDPVGRILKSFERPNGLRIDKVSVPVGVIGIIYESRPNVTADAAGICVSAGNAVILRGGSEAFCSNTAIAAALNRAASASGMADGVVQLLPFTEHEAVNVMLRMDKYIDLIIPRGGERLIRVVVENSTIPVIKHYKGVCHVYVDNGCDQDMALRIIENSKCQRPGVCNALETLLIDRAVAAEFAPKLAKLMRERHVELRGDAEFRALVQTARIATDEDYFAEYLALILAVRIVDGVEGAVDHINQYGSRHSDCIVSNDDKRIKYFFANVDSSTVYANASTRFTDGGEFGMGAEIGISTDKLHARGPMGADELTSYKYLVHGSGQIRD